MPKFKVVYSAVKRDRKYIERTPGFKEVIDEGIAWREEGSPTVEAADPQEAVKQVTAKFPEGAEVSVNVHNVA